MNLPPNIKLTDYIPDWDEIPNADLKDARDRIVAYLQTGIPDLDTSPNSVFGDLHINPLSHLVAAFETAANRMFSDLDLANVAAGTIWNCEYVKRYIDNFGQKERLEQPSSGVVQLVFSSPKRYIINEDSKFLFGDNMIFQLADRSQSIVIDRENVGSRSSNMRFFKQVDESTFTVNVAVEGPAGASVSEGDVASTDLAIPELIEVRAIADFDQGLLPTSLTELASNVGKTFYSASLNNRAGAITYILTNFPEMIGTSPIMSGDPEMLRDTTNLLGLSEGKADIYVKYRQTYLSTVQTVELVYDPEIATFVGLMDLGSDVPTYVNKAFRTSTNDEVLINRIIGKSKDPARFPFMTAGFSDQEQLGLQIEDFNALINQHAELSAVSKTTSAVNVYLDGQYSGSEFSTSTLRNLVLRLTHTGLYEGEQVVFGSLKDTDTTETILVKFRRYEDSAMGVVIADDIYNSFLKGVDIKIEFVGDSSFVHSHFVMPEAAFMFSVKGQTSNFDIHYRYDPNIASVKDLINDKEARAVNVDLVVKNFLTCFVNNITINYRVRAGQSVDLDSARAEIFNYVNSIVYPNVYEPSQVMEILIYYGAHGVQSVSQHGKFYRSLADAYVIDDELVEVDNLQTTTLIPPADSKGIGLRNINYILDLNNITFNVQSI